MRFKKSERLCNRKIIDNLFVKGNIFFVGNFKVLWNYVVTPTDIPLQVCISVPKRHFKHAVDRNLIKRRIREAYRLNKDIFYQDSVCNHNPIALMLVYKDNKISSYIDIETSIKDVLRILGKKTKKGNPLKY